MDWKVHMLTPLLIYIFIILIFQPPFVYSIQALLLVIFSSFIPELDHPRSVARKIAFIVIFYLMLIAIMVEISIDIWMKVIIIIILLIITRHFYKKLPLRHRGKHSLHLWRYCLVFPTIFIFIFLSTDIDISLASFVVIGYASHLALDKIDKF